MPAKCWSGSTRALHWGLVATITFQLFTGLYISTPGTLTYFYFHEWGGIVSSGVILLVWLWSYANYDLPLLFPWNRAGMADIVTDLRGLFRGKLPRAGRVRGLSSFIHGLGLLAVTGMAVTGILIFLVIPGGHGARPASTDYGSFTALSLLHKDIAVLVWLYWFGHVGFAFAHQFRGGHVFGGIFRFGRS